MHADCRGRVGRAGAPSTPPAATPTPPPARKSARHALRSRAAATSPSGIARCAASLLFSSLWRCVVSFVMRGSHWVRCDQGLIQGASSRILLFSSLSVAGSALPGSHWVLDPGASGSDPPVRVLNPTSGDIGRGHTGCVVTSGALGRMLLSFFSVAVGSAMSGEVLRPGASGCGTSCSGAWINPRGCHSG